MFSIFKFEGDVVMANANYEGTFELPSRGMLNETIPAEITMRGMTTKEEKILFASSGGNVFEKILKNCIVEPKDIDLGDMISADEIFLILQLRKLTYGNEYTVTGQCPECGAKESYRIDLDDFTIHYLPVEFEEPIQVKLPKSGDELSLKILRKQDIEHIEKQAKKMSKQFNLPVRELEYTMRMARFITAINGEKVESEEARLYVENMLGYDSAFFWSELNKIKVGYDTTVSVSCKSCQEDFEFDMPITREFFRPSFE